MSGCPPRPGVLAGDPDGVDIRFDFVSPFFTAQRASEAEKTQAFLSMVGQVALGLGREDILDNIHFDRAVDYLHEFLDVPATIMTTEEEFAQNRKARQDLAAAREVREEAVAFTDTVEGLSKAGVQVVGSPPGAAVAS